MADNEEAIDWIQRTGRNQLGPDAPWYIKGEDGSICVVMPGTPEYDEAERLEAQRSPLVEPGIPGIITTGKLSKRDRKALKKRWKQSVNDSIAVLPAGAEVQVMPRPAGLPITSEFALLRESEQQRMEDWGRYRFQKAQAKAQKRRQKAERVERTYVPDPVPVATYNPVVAPDEQAPHPAYHNRYVIDGKCMCVKCAHRRRSVPKAQLDRLRKFDLEEEQERLKQAISEIEIGTVTMMADLDRSYKRISAERELFGARMEELEQEVQRKVAGAIYPRNVGRWAT